MLTKPLIFDADTGGQSEHFKFTVRSLERLGVSAAIIEDKNRFKKRIHYLEMMLSKAKILLKIFLSKLMKQRKLR